MARTILLSAPRVSLMLSTVIPGAMEIIIWSFVTVPAMSESTGAKNCGLTASTMYLAEAAHSALQAAKETPVSSETCRHLPGLTSVNIISSFPYTFNNPFRIAYPMLPIPINPIFAIFLSSNLSDYQIRTPSPFTMWPSGVWKFVCMSPSGPR